MTKQTHAVFDQFLKRRFLFAYGSLMWNPGFSFLRKFQAVVKGFHRNPCVYSVHYRGSVEVPGLVLGLMPGGDCHGIVYEVSAEEAPQIFEYVIDRERGSQAFDPKVPLIYEEVMLPFEAEGIQSEALAFTVDSKSPRFVPHLSDDEKSRLIATSCGVSGPCFEYFHQTLEELKKLSVRDSYLEGLYEKACQLRHSLT